MVRELSEEEMEAVWHTLDGAEIIKDKPFWDWPHVIRIAYAKALFEAARVEQTCDRDEDATKK